MAKTFMVPEGRRPRAEGQEGPMEAMPLTTSLTVPSPPAATMMGSPAAAREAAMLRASPGMLVGWRTMRSLSALSSSMRFSA